MEADQIDWTTWMHFIRDWMNFSDYSDALSYDQDLERVIRDFKKGVPRAVEYVQQFYLWRLTK